MYRPSGCLQVGAIVLAVGCLFRSNGSAAVPAGIYGLSPESAFEEGCFEPCECPLLLARGVGGEFTLIPQEAEGDVRVFEVADLLWDVSMADGPMEVKGSGTFRVGDGPEPLQRMELDLAVGTRPVQRFDTGWIPGRVASPEIDLVLSMHGLFCFDIVFRVKAISLGPPSLEDDLRRHLWPLPGRLPKPNRGAETTWGRLKALYPGRIP